MPTTTLKAATSNSVVSTNRVSQIRILKKKTNKPVDILRKFRREQITTSVCNGTVGAGSINRAAIELGLLEKPELGKFFDSYRVTHTGEKLGIKATQRSVRYSDEAVSLLRNFFLANVHQNHGFIRI